MWLQSAVRSFLQTSSQRGQHNKRRAFLLCRPAAARRPVVVWLAVVDGVQGRGRSRGWPCVGTPRAGGRLARAGSVRACNSEVRESTAEPACENSARSYGQSRTMHQPYVHTSPGNPASLIHGAVDARRHHSAPTQQQMWPPRRLTTQASSMLRPRGDARTSYSKVSTITTAHSRGAAIGGGGGAFWQGARSHARLEQKPTRSLMAGTASDSPHCCRSRRRSRQAVLVVSHHTRCTGSGRHRLRRHPRRHRSGKPVVS